MNRTLRTGGPGLLGRLLGWRLRFYANSTLKLLNRRWQILLLMLLILSPASMPLAAQIQVIATPVRQIVAGDNAIYSLNAWLIGLLLTSAWVGVQAEALRGGPAWRYLRTLPAVANLESAVDLMLLMIADLPLLLPFLAYAISAPLQNRVENVVLVSVLAGQWPLYQHLLLRRSAATWLVVAASLAATLVLCRDNGQLPAIALVAAGSIAALALGKYRMAWPGPASIKPWRPNFNRRQGPLTNLIYTDLLVLMQRSRWPQWAAAAAYGAGVFWFGGIWREVGFKVPVAAALLIASLLQPLFQSVGLQTCLRTVREPLLPLFASWGVSARLLLTADAIVLAARFSLLSLPSIAAMHAIVGWHALLLLPVGCASLILLLPLYAYDNPSRLLPKLGIAAMFLYGTWLLFENQILSA